MNPNEHAQTDDVRPRARSLFAPISVGVLLTVLFGIVAFLAAGGGHGTYVPAALLFPGALLLATALTTISDAVLCVGAAQWPLYGAAVGLASRRGYTKEAIAYLGLFHALLVAACFAFDRSGQFLW